MGLPKQLAAPLALSFALIAGTVHAEEQNNTQSFTCDMPAGASTWSQRDKIRHAMSTGVSINVSRTETIEPQEGPSGNPMEDLLRRFFGGPEGQAPEAAPEGEAPEENAPEEQAPEAAPEEQAPEVNPDAEIEPEAPEQREVSALGSGTIIDSRGYITTNNHVVGGAEKITVTFFQEGVRDAEGETVTATLIGTDEKTDLAVIKVDVDFPLPCAVFADSSEVFFGDYVWAIGNPIGQHASLSDGVVSNPIRAMRDSIYTDYIQTNADINRGNSGGGLYNRDFEVIGTNVAILSPSGGSIGIGFAILGNTTAKIAHKLILDGTVKRGMMGINIQDLRAEEAAELGLPEDQKGVLISEEPSAGFPGNDAGLHKGDVIVEANGNVITKTEDLIRSTADVYPGNAANFVIIRNGELMEVELVLGDRDEIEARMMEQREAAIAEQQRLFEQQQEEKGAAPTPTPAP